MWIVNRQRVPMTPYQLLNTKYMMDTITRLRSCFPRISRQFPHLTGKSCGSFELCLTLCAAVQLRLYYYPTPYKSLSLSFLSEPFSCRFDATAADRRGSSDAIYREKEEGWATQRRYDEGVDARAHGCRLFAEWNLEPMNGVPRRILATACVQLYRALTPATIVCVSKPCRSCT